ncbi:helix-turn-helix transcriptional regulator [Alkalihalobacillus sp. AL-G]|uniref:helix-turn-helix transcriptional regulator n=1 Tax=Alkalihalobacillus sp. AL-G TaxID=2926399 RepID=UPI00272BF1CF|nr:helix-turn-helix transcriptional regulator [Alkalihalobacillus sp. AL-G]WLD92871.1 helix-turn-helix transcriptional regulator [Alkalihalobacillus sp. AL-G]
MPVENRLKEVRRNHKVTQLKMAEDLQITRQTIIAIENNKYNPSLELALKISAYFKMSVEALFTLKGEKGNE